MGFCKNFEDISCNSFPSKHIYTTILFTYFQLIGTKHCGLQLLKSGITRHIGTRNQSDRL